MTGNDSRQQHWDNAYASKGEVGVSWFEAVPEMSLQLIRSIAGTTVVDIGGGASRLVDELLTEGGRTVTVLDVSEAALNAARARLGAAADQVEWIHADVTRWQPIRSYDIWHDRAAFHFLTEPGDRADYVDCLHVAVREGGHVIIATFALDGPERCSGLPVMRYDPAALAGALGPSFALRNERRYVHTTPWGSTQAFQFTVLQRVGS